MGDWAISGCGCRAQTTQQRWAAYQASYYQDQAATGSQQAPYYQNQAATGSQATGEQAPYYQNDAATESQAGDQQANAQSGLLPAESAPSDYSTGSEGSAASADSAGLADSAALDDGPSTAQTPGDMMAQVASWLQSMGIDPQILNALGIDSGTTPPVGSAQGQGCDTTSAADSLPPGTATFAQTGAGTSDDAGANARTGDSTSASAGMGAGTGASSSVGAGTGASAGAAAGTGANSGSVAEAATPKPGQTASAHNAYSLDNPDLCATDVKAHIKDSVSRNWDQIRSSFHFSNDAAGQQQACAFFEGVASRESGTGTTMRTHLTTGEGSSYSKGPLQTADTAYANNGHADWEKDSHVAGIKQADLSRSNDLDTSIDMGIRHMCEGAERGKLAGHATTRELQYDAMAFHNTGHIDAAREASWRSSYGDEIEKMAAFYQNHTTDANVVYTGQLK